MSLRGYSVKVHPPSLCAERPEPTGIVHTLVTSWMTNLSQPAFSENVAVAGRKVAQVNVLIVDFIKPELPEDAYEFFRNTDIHDGELLEFRVLDGSRPAPVGEPSRPWTFIGAHPVRVKLVILDAYDQFLWQIEYGRILRAVVDFSSDEPIFRHEDGGFGDLGYRELTDAGGIIGMCMHCRRTRRSEEPDIWDWVPEFLAKPPDNVSHGLCPTCFRYYYPQVASTMQRGKA